MLKATNINGKLLPRLFWIVILASFFAWFFALLINPHGKQLDLFFLRMADFWADATNTTGYVSGLDPYYNSVNGLQHHNYPPLPYLLFYLLAHVSMNPINGNFYPLNGYLAYYYQPIWTILFVIALVASLILLFTVCVRQLHFKSYFDSVMVGFSLLLSYPMLFTIERGNVLIIAVLAVTIFVFYYDDECKWKREIALISLATAIGIKLSPSIFVLLLFYKKDWKSLYRVCLYSIIFLLLPLCYFEGGFYNNVLQVLSNIKLHFMYHSEAYGTGLIASYVKYAKFFWGDNFEVNVIVLAILRFLKVEVAALLLLGSCFLKDKWIVVLNLTLVLLILPSVSGGYCMLYMIPFTVLFLNSLIDHEKASLDKVLVFFCLLLIYFVYRCDMSNFFNYNFAVPILALISSLYSITSILEHSKQQRIVR